MTNSQLSLIVSENLREQTYRDVQMTSPMGYHSVTGIYSYVSREIDLTHELFHGIDQECMCRDVCVPSLLECTTVFITYNSV